MSLVGARYAAGSTRWRIAVTLKGTSRTTDARVAGCAATALARLGGSPWRAVTNQPPHRSTNGVRWSVMMAVSSRSGVPSGPGTTEPTNTPGTPAVFGP